MSFQTLMAASDARCSRGNVSDARLRLCLRLLSAAAEAKPSLYTTDGWRIAHTETARLVGMKAELTKGTK